MIILENSWPTPALSLELSSTEVQVWRLNLKTQIISEEELISRLSVQERRRAASYLSRNARRQFIHGRWALRTILGYYLNTEPDLIEFHYGRYGKPYIEDGYGEDAIQFSLAHSHDLVLYAFTRGRRVGIDVELVQDFLGIEPVLQKLFPEHQAVPRNEKIKTFFDHWTGQEAQLKAVGTGFAGCPEGSVKGNHRMTDWENTKVTSGWSELTFAPSSHYTGTVVVEGTTTNCRFLSFKFN